MVGGSGFWDGLPGSVWEGGWGVGMSEEEGFGVSWGESVLAGWSGWSVVVAGASARMKVNDEEPLMRHAVVGGPVCTRTCMVLPALGLAMPGAPLLGCQPACRVATLSGLSSRPLVGRLLF